MWRIGKAQEYFSVRQNRTNVAHPVYDSDNKCIGNIKRWPCDRQAQGLPYNEAIALRSKLLRLADMPLRNLEDEVSALVNNARSIGLNIDRIAHKFLNDVAEQRAKRKRPVPKPPEIPQAMWYNRTNILSTNTVFYPTPIHAFEAIVQRAAKLKRTKVIYSGDTATFGSEVADRKKKPARKASVRKAKTRVKAKRPLKRTASASKRKRSR
jgi:hypothetical protein